jgi:hypothetical protein
MSNFDLLDTVLPSEGRYTVLGLGPYTDQTQWDTREEVAAQAEHLVKHGFDVYFGCAKFGPLNKRTKDNVSHVRALWMDIDCGPLKGVPDDKGIIKCYLTQELGLAALRNFCATVGLPRPIMVDSGYGIHAYWLLEETITRTEWEPLADRLRELCVEQGLIVDPSVFEAARVLRIPGTFNFKQAEPKEVTVINEDTPRMAYAYIKELLGAAEPKPEQPDFLPRAMSPMMEAMMGNKVKRFSAIMMRGEGGCAQLVHCFQNQESIDEPLWRSALSIAAFCVDKDSAAHKLSNKHPNYNPGEVDDKVANLVAKGGPHHCNTFAKLNPQGCAGCKHSGKITSPIMLGIELEEAEVVEGEYVVPAEEDAPAHRIPEYPFPFTRGVNGGIWRKGEDAEDEPALVYEHDLYVVKRMKDPELGETALFRLHLPMDGVKEFVIPLASIAVKEKLREALAHQGVAAHPKQLENLMYFIVTFMKALQYAKKAEIMRTQFGWVDNDSKFIIGDREITKDGVFYSPPSHTTRLVAEKMVSAGSLEKWKEVFNMYAKPGLEPHAFAALTSFGSPLLKFTGMSGAIINVIHKSSGSGKSTALYMCNSIWGHPKELASMWKDTANVKMHRLGVMNNLPNTIDEITNTSPMEFSDLAYSISQGRGKNRMKSSTNEERINNTSWQGITLASANASFYEKLGAAKNSPDGESMRLLEYRIEPNSVIGVAEGKQMFDHQLFENYGHAGEIYAKYLVDNLEDVKDLIRQIQARIDKEVQFTARERFWSAVAACNIAGGLIAKNLGLHEFDMKVIYKWMTGMLNEMRDEVTPPQSSPVTILGEFINAHMNNALVVNGEADARSTMTPMPILEPKGELLIRYEPDTKFLFVAAKQFKDYCVKFQINYRDVLKQLKDTGLFVEAVNKRMAKGMRMVSPAVRTLHFNAVNFESVQMDVLIANEDRVDPVPD